MKDSQVVSMFDVGSLQVVSNELRLCFEGAISALSDSGDIAQAVKKLSAAKGALDLSNMEGAARFCAAAENFVATMQRGSVAASANNLAIARRGVADLASFVASVLNGLPNNPLALYPAYLDICNALGLGNSISKADLFFPDIGVFVSKSLEASPVRQDEVSSLARGERAVYEKGLLAWLRRHDSIGLKNMREAIVAIERTQVEPKERTFWWIATALTDALLHEGLAPNNEVNRALGRINFQMRRLVNGQSSTPDALLREVLYFVAISDNVGGRVSEAKRMFNLDSYLSEARAIARAGEIEERVQPVLAELTQILEAAPAHWMKYIGSEGVDGRQSVERDFIRVRDGFAKVGRQDLSDLAQDMLAAVDISRDDLEGVALDVSSALMLMGTACENFTRLADDFDRSVLAQRNRLTRAMGRPVEAGADYDHLPLLDEIGTKAQERDLLATVVREMHANIAEMELTLDEFFRDDAKRSGLMIIKPKSEQIFGALSMLDLGKATEVIKGFIQTAEKFLIDGYAPTQGEMEFCAELLTSLDVYLGELKHGNMEAERGLYPVLERLGHGTDFAGTTDFEVPAVLTTESMRFAQTNRDTANEVDSELLDVFLDEAADVLGNIERNLAVCQKDSFDRDSLTVIRRGFHTLKGSGRMVGLYSIGEAAWAMEQVFNKWIEEERPVTPALLDLAAKAHSAFLGWVAGLRDSGSADVSSDLGVEAASFCARAVVEPDMAQEAMATVIVDEAPSDVVVGDAIIPAQLFSIFLSEAARCLAGLEDNLARFRVERVASYDFMRAAHTICGISGTVQLGAISELSYALERLLTELMNPAAAGAVEADELIGRVIELLYAKVDDVTHSIPPAPEPQMISALMDLAQRVSDAARAASVVADIGIDVSAVEPQEASAPDAIEMADAFADSDDGQAQRVDTARLKFDIATGEPASGMAVAGEKSVEADIEAAAPNLLADEIVTSAQNIVFNAGTLAAPVAGNGVFARLCVAAPGVDDDIDEQLLPVFLEEAQDLVPSLGEQLRDWRKQPTSQVVSGAVRRSLHTIKGSARMVGAMRVGELAHNMETTAIEAVESQAVSDAVFESLQDCFDLIDGVVRAMERGEFADVAEVESDPADMQFSLANPQALLEAVPPAPTKQIKSLIRIHSDIIDALATDVGESSIARSRIEGELASFKQSLKDMSENVSRLKGQLREIEIQAEAQMQSNVSEANQGVGDFDPLEFDRFTRLHELTRMAAESVNDISALQMSLSRNLGESEAAVSQQARLAKDVQQVLMRVRLVPVRTITERLRQVVRQTAKELDKQVEIEIVGEHIEMDRNALERITAPFEHLLRNAVDHGIEMPEARRQAGKPEQGRVKIVVEREREEIVIEVSDDGAGIDLDKVRAKAASMGLLRIGQLVSDAKLYDFLFWSGFSTASKLTQVSGRGIGMDVVRSEITQLGGRIELDSKRGEGSRFRIYLPMTLATMQVVLVMANGEMFAVPSVMVEQVQVMKEAELVEAYRVGAVDWMGSSYPLFYLPRLFGLDVPIVKSRYNTLVLLRSGRYGIAVHIDRLLSNTEVVTKNIGRQLAAVPGVVGATVLGDGSEVVIVNPVSLAREFLGQVVEPTEMVDEKIVPAVEMKAQASIGDGQISRSSSADDGATAKTVMVVDDSLTVRKITRRLLEREGYRVIDAKDGLDALEKLQNEKPGIMLVDVEMPRMDGFELTKNVRADASMRHIPIIMITSRTAEKHRNHAFELGVNVYLGKPYQEGELLANIRELIGTSVEV